MDKLLKSPACSINEELLLVANNQSTKRNREAVLKAIRVISDLTMTVGQLEDEIDKLRKERTK